jgi:hypothetical protein
VKNPFDYICFYKSKLRLSSLHPSPALPSLSLLRRWKEGEVGRRDGVEGVRKINKNKCRKEDGKWLWNI